MPLFHRIVCPTDFSPTAADAVAYACDLARSAKAEHDHTDLEPALFGSTAERVVRLACPALTVRKPG